MRNQADFYGKKIFVGLDVHKKSFALCAICDGEQVGKASMNSSHEGLLKYLSSHFVGAEIILAYEAGFSGYSLHRYLEGNGITCFVVHAASIEVSSRDRVKTDKRDAAKIAHQLSQGRLQSIRVPSIQEEQNRSLSRGREQIVELRADIARQIKSKLMYFGLLDANDDRLISESFLKEIESTKLPKEAKFVLRSFADIWRDLSQKIKSFDQELAKQAESDEKVETTYRSVPGIGKVSSRILANELGDLKQFSSVDKLYSFTGLTPSEYSSGNTVRKGHISRQGSSRIRKTLVECAWRAVEKDPALKSDYERIAARAGKKRAIVGVARRLIGRVRACFQKDCKYTIGYEPQIKGQRM
jgi:transposase